MKKNPLKSVKTDDPDDFIEEIFRQNQIQTNNLIEGMKQNADQLGAMLEEVPNYLGLSGPDLIKHLIKEGEKMQATQEKFMSDLKKKGS